MADNPNNAPGSGRETNLWRATSRGGFRADMAAGDIRADVAIVGAGIMGAVTALTLARAGLFVVVLEADRVGEGASSRAGGFVVPHFSFGNPRDLVDRMGEKGERLANLVGKSANRVFDLIKEHGIQCDAQQGGWYQPAHSDGALATIEQTARAWQDLGFAVEILGGAETEARTGVAGYRGSWFTPTGGTLHPLDYTLGLAQAAKDAGARFFEHSPVTAIAPVTTIDRNGEGFELKAETASIRAKHVVVTTNALSNGLVPDLESSVVRIGIWQCATAPLPHSVRKGLFSHGECLSDTRANLFTYRFDRDGRLITGALAAYGRSAERNARDMARRFQVMLGLEEQPKVDFLWQGTASVTPTRLPEVVRTRDGVLAATACNGRGIALATVTGEALANGILSGTFEDLPLPFSDLHGTGAAMARVPVRLQQVAAGFYPYYARLCDWMESG